ncbi:hypothetical protein ACH5RR_036693 [Cinchona calisaya]|uniref:ENHANCER OF AG-4 protein 2 n=1 Tax=Cinchona calisaya TaxID=153742 RepID=A0ABD2Y401_9GENT
MAPGRKRGAKGGGPGGGGGGGGGGGSSGGGGGGGVAKSKTQLNLGDLVLAKVKGFPAWPAKISRPEDWERAPDPKKYFVQFFGTEEIAFVAPADIQAFTSEAKNKLSARCQGKKVKYFTQAVREICEEFEQLQNKSSSCLREDRRQPALVSDAHSADEVIGDAFEAGLKEGTGNGGSNQAAEIRSLGDHGSGLEHCLQRQGETDYKDVKSCFSGDGNGGSSNRNMFPNDGANLLKEAILTSSSSSQSFHKESSCDRRVQVCSSKEMSSRGGSKGSDKCNLHAAEEGCVALLSSDHKEYSDVAEYLRDGQRPKLAVGLNRKNESSYQKHNIRGPAAPVSGGNIDPVSNQQSGDVAEKPIASGGQQSSQNVMKTDGGKQGKKLLNNKKKFDAKDKPGMGVVERSEEDKIDLFSKRQGQGKQGLQSNEVSHPAKRSKYVDVTNDSKVILQRSRKVDSEIRDEKMLDVEVKRSLLQGKAENRVSIIALPATIASNLSGDEDVLPPTKRRRRALEAMSTSSALNSENITRRSSATLKNEMSRRRAVRLCDDEEDEEPKTPIHEGSTKKVLVTSHGQNSTKRGDLHSSFNDQLDKRGSGTPEGRSSKKLVPSAQQLVEYLSPNSQQAEGKRHGKAVASHIPFSPGKVESKEGKPLPVSPKTSPLSVSVVKSIVDPEKSNKLLGKVPGNMYARKTPSATQGPGATSDSLNSSVNQPDERSKPEISAERNKATPKSHLKTHDLPLQAGSVMEAHSLHGERYEAGRDDKMSSSVDQRTSDSVTSMKHLIAAAQAKKRQAHLHNFNDNPNFLLALSSDAQVSNPSPAPVTHPMASSNMTPPDVQGFFPQSSITSPPSDVYQTSSINQRDSEEFVERRVSSGHQTAGGSLSGGTEAAVARDAFEGMIETLSRTKESIGRATRLAIDCAKYGIANEVVELLIRKLENEPSFHRKVDLFFLVDSITQCSHSHKGIAGASYIPAVQAALPRLLVAAAPPGSGARENRRQCLKVLRLWLERKILPDSLLRRYMDDIGVANDDISSGFNLRRPSRAERAIDDPIREMEGMLVDEYGSNATFQLPGFFSSRVFEEDEEEEEEIPKNPVKESANISPSEHSPVAGDLDNYTFTPSERRHHILEDVDGELEMEDVSGHQKDERSSITGDTFGIDPIHLNSAMTLESASNIPFELPPLPEGSPPLPLDSPPATPPLPSSLPPSPLPPPPPLSPAPLPPPPPQLQPNAITPQPIGPPPILPPQPSLQRQSSLTPKHVHLIPSSNLASSVVAYQQAPVLLEIGSNPSGNPLTQMAGNSSHGPPVEASIRNEMFAQQAPCFVPVGVGSSQEASGYNSTRPVEYGHNNGYISSLSSQPNMQFQPGNVPFMQRPLPLNPPPQNTPSHFSYSVPTIGQHPLPAVQHHPPAVQHPLPVVQHPPPHPYPPPYPVPNFTDGPRQFAADEQWRIRPNELNSDQRGIWMPGVRSCSGPAYTQDGYLMPPPERPSVGTAPFRPPVPNTFPGGTSVPGHGVIPMIPGRPDMSAFSWRPA